MFIVSVILYCLVGVVSFVMAYKALTTKKFLPFHEHASGVSWETLDVRMQHVILALTRISGLGFCTLGILLITFPIAMVHSHDAVQRYLIPGVSCFFCLGLFIVNRSLHLKTGADTPWKGALLAAGIILAGIVVTLVS